MLLQSLELFWTKISDCRASSFRINGKRDEIVLERSGLRANESKLGRPQASSQALASRIFAAGLGAAELLAIHLGIRLGLYEVFQHWGPMRPQEAATRAGVAPRYTREWLEQQAACGILLVDDCSLPSDSRLYMLPSEHAEVLLQPESPFYVGATSVLPVVGMAKMLPKLLDVYRTGQGIPYSEYGEEFRGGGAGINRSLFTHQFPGWIAGAVPELHARLLEEDLAIADLACGIGWSSIALAKAYPRANVHGFDCDEESLRQGRDRAGEAGVADRVSLRMRDITDSTMTGEYALVLIFDALHDLARPIEALRTCFRLKGNRGTVLLVEPNASESFNVPANDTERFLYTVSLFHCLPVGLSDRPSAATGTLMRPSTVLAYAMEAGFQRFETIPAQNRFYRIYRLQ